MIQGITIHQRIRSFHKLSSEKGLIVVGLESQSPAGRARLHKGDIIIEFDWKTVQRSNGLFKLLTKEKIFKQTKMKVLRKTFLKEIDIRPVEKRVQNEKSGNSEPDLYNLDMN